MPIKETLTTCPHCGMPNAFKPTHFKDGTLVMSEFPALEVHDVTSRNIVLQPANLGVYLKHCTNCGYIGMFRHDIVNQKGCL